MTPQEYYQNQVNTGQITYDDLQWQAMQQLERVYHALIQESEARQHWLAKWRRPKTVQGLYMWGGVGIGKTFMMDCLYTCLPFKNKQRLHFHQFMQWVHEALAREQGTRDPLQAVAKEMASHTMVLCFDEFFVTDIVDAMLMAKLLQALFAKGVTLVTTSNIPPDQLYWRGLQRDSFLPAIALLKQHTQLWHLQTERDYRLRYLAKAGVFHVPDDEAAEKKMAQTFEQLTQGHEVSTLPILVYDRSIAIKQVAGDVIWFDFADLCAPPRSQQDYLYLSKRYRIVLISHVPVIASHADNTINLWIRLIDVFYDARMHLVLSAAAPVDQLYQSGKMLTAYLRTQSRLMEMQGRDVGAN